MRLDVLALATIFSATMSVPFATHALAHAHLQSATPANGSTLAAAPTDIRLTFTQNVVVALCKVSLAGPDGTAIAVGKPMAESKSAKEVRVDIPSKLAAGSYKVMWRAVAVDTHATTGTFTFKVAP